MNKIEFLRRLDRELEVLDKEERKELLAFYEERFYSGTIYENKTEAEVISELESPETIARNILEEYGVSPKFVKSKEERYSNINNSQVIWLIIFDVFVASWVIPTLFSVVFGLFVSLFSYIGVFGLLIGERTTTDIMTFVFLSGIYVLIFLFALVMFDVTLSITKKLIVYHMNVFKMKNREKIAKSFNKVSVDGWFKKHKVINLVKTLVFIGAIFTIIYSGYYLFTGEDNLFDVYSNQPKTTDIYTEDVAQDVIDGETWKISTSFDSMDINIVPGYGDEIVITHKYSEFNDFTINIDTITNVITLTNDDPTVIQWFNLNDLFVWFGENDSITIEVPVGLDLADVILQSYNGEVTIMDLNTDKIDINITNGQVSLSGLEVHGNVNIETTNGSVNVKNIIGKYNLTISSTNGQMTVKNVEFLNYDLSTTNGGFNLDNLNVAEQDGVSLKADTTNGDIEMDEVYVSDVRIETTNGDITYYNDDETFDLDRFDRDTTNGDISTNIR